MSTKRIAVIKGSSIGDAILSFPLLRNIRANFPEADITVITGEASSGLDVLRSCPYINRVIHLPVHTLAGKVVSALRLANLRLKSFDVVFDGAPVTKRSQQLAALLPARRRASIRNYNLNRQLVDMDLSMLSDMGLKTDDGHLELFFNIPAARSDRRLVLLYLGRDVDHERTWAAEHWARAIETLAAKHPRLTFSLIGGGDNAGRAAALLKLTTRPITDYTGKLTLTQTVRLLKTCRLLIATNGGPMQLAAAAGTPLVALHGPSPDMWLPHGRRVINIHPLRRPPVSTIDPNALYADRRFSPETITPTRVVQAAERLLAR